MFSRETNRVFDLQNNERIDETSNRDRMNDDPSGCSFMRETLSNGEYIIDDDSVDAFFDLQLPATIHQQIFSLLYSHLEIRHE